MRVLFFLSLLFIFSCNSNSKNEIDSFIWNESRIYKVDDNWLIEIDGIVYPGNKLQIEGFLNSFSDSNIVLIATNTKDIIEYYNIGKNSIAGFSFGLLTPGSLGRYAVDNNNYLYMIEGKYTEYPLNFDWRDKTLQLGSNPVYFHFKPIDSLYEEILYFNESGSIANYNNLLRANVISLIPGFHGSDIGEVEIKDETGEIYSILIKKGANGYLLNLMTPYSYLISEIDFKNIISSF